ncbi:Exodeoxyribonuclease I subunit D [Arthrobacter alpinus]|uniref:Nuclease SbcCD subunit D n=1 Tax=Arthrobacter alpinus TaxID=656366 RepID=A0A1H5EWK9_9MICC|nr:exonuclease SbcCD subunit D [Arthrobacter alpinus]SED95495.1 Exodeoxyribonuclease I subunit D [Arthrobacter alpinus]
MKLLHTSDWHLGRSFHGVGTLDAQRRFAGQLVDTVIAENVDVVLLAGDVYDRALPNVDVVKLFDDMLARLTALGTKVIITSGNHDSATRLGFAGRVMEAAGVYLRTRIADLDTPVVLPLTEDGNGPVLAIYGIPFLEPRIVADELGVDQASHFTVTEAAVTRIRADLATRAEGSHAVVLAHTFASGGITSASERELAIGGVGAVPVDLFEGFAYAALGHLHGRQQLRPNVRYSGSPLPYSFSEANHTKGGWLVEVTEAGLGQVRAVDWPGERALSLVRGKLEDLLIDPQFSAAEDSYCQITLTDDSRPANAMERLRARFPHTLVLIFEPENVRDGAAQSYSQRVSGAVDELDLCCGFLDHVRQRPATEPETAVLRETLAAVHAEVAAR